MSVGQKRLQCLAKSEVKLLFLPPFVKGGRGGLLTVNSEK